MVGMGAPPLHTRGSLTVAGSKQKPRVSGLDQKIFEQVVLVDRELRALDLPKDRGPYADSCGTVSKFAKTVFGGLDSSSRHEPSLLAEHIIDLRMLSSPLLEINYPRLFSPPQMFEFDPNFVPSSLALPTASAILSDRTRLRYNPAMGYKTRVLCDPMEEFIVGVSLLRHEGVRAYPARIVIPGAAGTEDSALIIAIVDATANPTLMTFNMVRHHPPFSAIDLLSDVAVDAMLHGMRAGLAVKCLERSILKRGTDKKFDEAALQARISPILANISTYLYECHVKWPGAPILLEVLQSVLNSSHAAVTERLSSSIRNPNRLQDTAVRFATDCVETVQSALRKQIESASR